MDGGIVEQGGVLKENLLTNSGFDVWSNSTLVNATGTKLHPENNCTDPDNDTDSTTGWSSHNGGTLSSEESVAGFSGSVLKVLDTAGADGSAYFTAATVVGKLYKLVFTQKNGDNRGFVTVGQNANDYDGDVYEVLDNASATVSTIVFEASFTTTYVSLGSLDDVDYCYFNDVSLYEVTPGCVAADGVAMDGWWKQTSLDIWRQHNDATHTKEGSFYSLKVTAAGTNQFINWKTFGASGTTVTKDTIRGERLAGRTVTAGCWVKSDGTNDAGIQYRDYLSSTWASRSYGITTSSSWTWIEGTHTWDTSTSPYFNPFMFYVENGGTAYFSQPMLVFGNSIGEGNYSRPPGEIVWFDYYSRIVNNGTPVAGDDKILNLEALSNGKIPKGIKAVHLLAQGEHATATTNQGIQLGADSTGQSGYPLRLYPPVSDMRHHASGWVYCDTNGDIYQNVTTLADTFSNYYIDVMGVELR